MTPQLTLTSKLMSIPSTKESPSQLLSVLELVKTELSGFNYKEFTNAGIPSLLFYNAKEVPEKFKIILNAHLDVVPGRPDQYQAKTQDGKLWGRGAIDMKGGAACEILAFKSLAKKVNYPLGLQLVTDEEVGGFHGTKYQIDQGVTADFVIAGEPTDLDLNNEAKGIAWVNVKAAGTPGHGAYPWKGDNALWKIHDFLARLKTHYSLPEREAWVTTVNLAKIGTSNETYNKIPDEAEVRLDFRYVPSDTDTIMGTIKQLAGPDLDVQFITKEPSQHTDKSNRYLKYLAETITESTGKPPKFIQKHGASDIRHYDRIKVPGVCFGPTGDGLHSDQEWVDISSLNTYSEILETFLMSL